MMRPLTITLFILFTIVLFGTTASAQRKGFVPQAESTPSAKRKVRKAQPKGPQYKQAERSRAETKALARDKRKRQFEVLNKMIKTNKRVFSRKIV